MFSDLKKKFNSVIQEGKTISETLSNTYIRQTSDTTQSVIRPTTGGSIPKCIKLTAGCSYLEHKEQQWQDLHEQNELNAMMAIEIDLQIHNLKDSSAQITTNISDLNVSLLSIPSINTTLKTCTELVKQIQLDIAKVEESLYEFEDLIEVLELQEKQLNYKFEIALYKEKKLGKILQIDCIFIF